MNLSPELARTFDTIAARVGDPVRLLGQLASSDESLPELADRIARHADLPADQVAALFNALLDEGLATDGAHGGEWGGWE